jgi:hypothetical protein
MKYPPRRAVRATTRRSSAVEAWALATLSGEEAKAGAARPRRQGSEAVAAWAAATSAREAAEMEAGVTATEEAGAAWPRKRRASCRRSSVRGRCRGRSSPPVLQVDDVAPRRPHAHCLPRRRLARLECVLGHLVNVVQHRHVVERCNDQ